ncbi:alpha/beta hydrolase-fold protein [Puia sp. P3]|uniref:carboxylesterase family protein n=1 Tax=Puia sp. P3 TaxID=3423952 RepID=UPI003D66D3EA
MNKLFKILAYILASFLLAPAARTQQTAEKMVREVNYLLYLPQGYAKDSTQKWPLLLFLHGSGERGDDLEKLKTHGPPKLIAQGRQYPFIVVSPQAREGGGWDAQQLYELLQDCKHRFRVDPDRVYLTGLSMGGFGTWDLALKHPEEFAAIIPICGGGDTTDAWRLRNMPVWCFHGAKDNTVPIIRDQQMVGAVGRYNPSVKFTVYPEAGHDSWTVTYNNDSVYTWLLSKKRFQYSQTPVSASVLRSYPGTYASADKDTVVIRLRGDSLFAVTRQHPEIYLKAASPTVFFIKENEPIDLRFDHNAAGRLTGFTVFERNRNQYRKIKN